MLAVVLKVDTSPVQVLPSALVGPFAVDQNHVPIPTPRRLKLEVTISNRMMKRTTTASRHRTLDKYVFLGIQGLSRIGVRTMIRIRRIYRLVELVV
jgi:hypothetical protein